MQALSLLQTLQHWLPIQTACLAIVTTTFGSTPRQVGALMIASISQDTGELVTHGSIGGGKAEAKVARAMQALMANAMAPRSVAIDLRDAAREGVCGGRMHVELMRMTNIDTGVLNDWVAQLQAGAVVNLPLQDPVQLLPPPMLAIFGAGHCGAALHALMTNLGWRCWLIDDRRQHQSVLRWLDELPLQGAALAMAVLLNRNFDTDVQVLNAIAARPRLFNFIGVMGSKRRMHAVRAGLSQAASQLALVSPIGLDIGAQTPDEIAVSIAAQLIAHTKRATISD